MNITSTRVYDKKSKIDIIGLFDELGNQVAMAYADPGIPWTWTGMGQTIVVAPRRPGMFRKKKDSVAERIIKDTNLWNATNYSGQSLDKPVPLEQAFLNTPVTAYRSWSLGWVGNNEPRLVSRENTVWEPRVKVKATHNVGADSWISQMWATLRNPSVPPDPHDAPHRDCMCGWNAYRKAPSSPIHGLYGSVGMSGRVIEFENGYRAEYAWASGLYRPVCTGVTSYPSCNTPATTIIGGSAFCDLHVLAGYRIPLEPVFQELLRVYDMKELDWPVMTKSDMVVMSASKKGASYAAQQKMYYSYILNRGK